MATVSSPLKWHCAQTVSPQHFPSYYRTKHNISLQKKRHDGTWISMCICTFILGKNTSLICAHWQKCEYLCACTLFSFLGILLLLRTFAIQHPVGCVLDQGLAKGNHFLNCIKETLWQYKELTPFSFWCTCFPFLMYVRKIFTAGTAI